MFAANSIPASCFAYQADALPNRDAWPEDVPAAADWRLWHKIINASPEKPFIYHRPPTVLHFSAKRKQARNSQSGELAYFLAIADRADWWPASLKQTIPDNATEQSIYASLLFDPAENFAEKLRRDAYDLTCRLTWSNIQALTGSQILPLQQEIDRLNAQASADRSEIETLKQNIQALSLDLTNKTREVETLRNARSLRLARKIRQLFRYYK